ncbi:heparan-alpha-glucosaminide N-acetyltransferase [Plutella xylostella]|uniref:heparan-alpha-glucosaminide N-acetyltransferase n=1 Tax=Plutella xylostella TaxID=51655 RepID=UPI00203308D1|nr:heparan-alpha-glucosaminide N-acetyltransferase [Plutella xylostella]
MSLGVYENVGYFIRECDGRRLRYDQACLQVITSEKVSFWSQYLECEGCALLETATFKNNTKLVFGTTSPLKYAVHNANGEICNGTYQFGEFGQYDLNLTEVTTGECAPKMTAEPDAAYLPILTAIVILFSMATLWYIVKGIGKRVVAGRMYARFFNREDNELGSDTRVLTGDSAAPRAPTRSRLRSLDIFRGFAVALMIFVNSGGGGYDIFRHSVWNGLTLADLAAPWFAFAMGQALVLALHSRLRTSMTRWTAFMHVARRSLFLAIIGIVLGSVNSGWSGARLPGVLQRLAALHLLAGAVEVVAISTDQGIVPGHSLIRDIRAGWKQWLFTLSLVAIHLTVTLTVAAPGCPRGYLGPGGLHLSEHGNYSLQNCTGGISGYIDREILGPSHLYQHGTFKDIYHTTVPYDPEGLLGVLSGVLVLQAGAHAARLMLAYNHARARIMRWVFYSIIFGLAGGGLCQFSKNGGPIPVNKNLWSVSYCLVTSSMAFFAQAVLYYVVDLKNRWGGRPFYYAGQNALVIYIGSELLKNHVLFNYKIPYPTHAQLLTTNTATAMIWLAIAIALHRKRIFITI